MIQRLHLLIRNIWYSLPVRLVVRQLHSHKFLLLFWIFLLAILSGAIGESFGGSYLFLEPEYLGKENFWSTLLVGSSLGAFLFAYMITFYINESYRFHFLGMRKHPFFLMAWNNQMVPGSFLLVYFYRFLTYHQTAEYEHSWKVVELFSGLILGILLVFILSASYFFAEASLFVRFGKKLERGIERSKPEKSRWVILGKARESLRYGQRADFYLEFPFRIKKISGPDTTRLSALVEVLNQHHGKLLLLQILTFGVIAVLGLMEENPFFQIPAGASFLLMLSFFMMAIGAATFWFRKAGLIAIMLAFLAFYFHGDLDILRTEHRVSGINYETAPAIYSAENLLTLQNDSIYAEDLKVTHAYLESWKKRYQATYGADILPYAVFVSASGGGLRSAFWTFRTMQYLDSISQGRMSDEIRLYTGASGGMFGLSYFRELLWRRSQDSNVDLQDRRYSQNMSKDLLNRIFFRMFSGLFLPQGETVIDGQSVKKEAGYSFDRQVEMNLPEIEHRRIGDYARAESAGIVAPMILTPSVINQGRKLFICSQPVSYLVNPGKITNYYQGRPNGIEFRRLFANHRPDSLYLVSALRMNATFPFISPVPSLPSKPAMKVMDAGVLDNFGTQTSIRYLFTFRKWFEENTAGIILVQIRDTDREEPIGIENTSGIVSKLLMPIGGGYKSMLEANDLANDHLLEYVKEWYSGPIEVLSFEYPLQQLDQPASLSWHLTRREKQTIEQALSSIRVQQGLMTITDSHAPSRMAGK